MNDSNACVESVFDSIVNRLAAIANELDSQLDSTKRLIAKLSPQPERPTNGSSNEIKRSEPTTIAEKLNLIADGLERNLKVAEENNNVLRNLVG